MQLSHRPGVQVQAVAAALDIHPFMLSRWRKEAREGRLRPATPGEGPGAEGEAVREIAWSAPIRSSRRSMRS